MDKPQVAPAARGVMRLPAVLALQYAEKQRPGVTPMFEALRAAHPHYNWRLALMKAKEQWDAADAKGAFHG